MESGKFFGKRRQRMSNSQQTTLTFWSGLDTIGGNIVEILHQNYRIITDFGAINGASLEDLQDKTKTLDLLSKAQLPAIEGLYEKSHLQGQSNLEAYEESALKTIICLSHLHLDHIGSFGQLPSGIPIYALEEGVHFYGKLATLHLLPSYEVNWQAIKSGVPFDFGPFKIEFMASDHDTIGAASIFITAPDIKIINSGDFRLTGFNPERVLDWVTKARAFKPDLFLVEGTTFSFEEAHRDDRMHLDAALQSLIHSISASNEQRLILDIKRVLLAHPQQLAVLNVYPQNIERLIEIARIAHESGRLFVLEPNYYALLQEYLPKNILINYLSVDEHFGATQLDKSRAVSLDDMTANPEKYLLQVDYDQSHELIYRLPSGIYIHSNGVPLGSYNPAYLPWLERLVNYGYKFYHAHVSGHANTSDLQLVNYVVNAKVTVPWHTFKRERYQEALKQLGLTVALPEVSHPYTVEALQSLSIKD